MSDIIFIKNEQDYFEYKKLKPIRIFSRKKVKFICSQCKQVKEKTFRCLRLDFLCSTCINKNNQLNPEIQNKKKQTCLKKYGVDNYAKTEESKNRIKQTCLLNYGVESTNQLESKKEKIKKTNKERYGVEYATQSDIIKEKIKNTCNRKYGVDWITQVPAFIEKNKQSNIEKYGVSTYLNTEECRQKLRQVFLNRTKEILQNKNIELLNKNNDNITCKCLTCNTIFTYDSIYFCHFLNSTDNTICPHCLRSNKNGKSKQEKEVLTYIKSIYNDIIIENTKHIIPNKELDIYLPNLKLAFEYDGTYWHADPRFYKENDLIWHKKVTADEIWKRDMEKDILCNQYKIKLIRVKEYDWVTDNVKEKFRILKIINEAINE